MEMILEQDAGHCLLRMEGEMTIYHAMEIKQKFMEILHDFEEVTVSLAKVTDMDTTGAQLLILIKKEAQATGRHLTLSDHSPSVLAVLDLYNLAGQLGDPMFIPHGHGRHGDRS
ncbi:STAS domain-containing protein [Ectothiorhodospira shaposhnikovii]|uniref:STAS domain-containing protein n=2 Tax=Ectothiorhodospira shaposhnikovii TaxID=1054 RepID=UPI0030B81736